eukprot:6054670-Amphidinium_carterae.2
MGEQPHNTSQGLRDKVSHSGKLMHVSPKPTWHENVYTLQVTIRPRLFSCPTTSLHLLAIEECGNFMLNRVGKDSVYEQQAKGVLPKSCMQHYTTGYRVAGSCSCVGSISAGTCSTPLVC